MSPKDSKNRNERYPNLYRLPNQPSWIFRKWSKEKNKQFWCSTGLESVDRNAPAAYRSGLEKFNEWLGAFLPTEGSTNVRDLARVVLAMKDDPELSDAWFRSVKNQIENHIIPAAGHMKPSQLTREWWMNYQREERKKPRTQVLKNGTVKELPPRTKLFNTRKVLMEVLKLAKQRGLIQDVPEFPLNDAEAAPPRTIPKETVLKIIRFAGRIVARQHKGSWAKESRYRIVPLKLLVFIMWKQGARPSEILQYRWDMIQWKEGTHGTIHIPALITKTRRARQVALNSKVARILRFLEPRKESPWLFPSPRLPGEHSKDYDSAWNGVMARLGLDFDIYNLRDTFITNRLKAGKSATYIAKYVDNSAAMIERKYAVAERGIMEDVAG